MGHANDTVALGICVICFGFSACGGKAKSVSSGSSGTVAATSGAVVGTGSESGNLVASGNSGNAGSADGGEPVSRCDPRSCSSGCCGPTGCLLGTSADACGFGGQACTDCTAIGLDCVISLSAGGGVCGISDAGLLADGAPACGPSNCAGCCLAGTCVAGTATGSCGSHGLACLPCTGSNLTCITQPNGGGACVGSGTPCGPSSCAGCCDTNGACQDSIATDACGAAGTACQFCLAGQVCNSGQCVTVNGCGPSSCPGCCQGETCLSGSENSMACGSGGASCQSCPNNIPCVPLGPKNGGVCATSPACGSGTGLCGTGCCDIGPAGTCHTGNTSAYCTGPDNHCGTCGGSCETGACIGGPFCDSNTCPNGGCMPDGTCWNGGVDDAHCGGGRASVGGQLAINCGPGYACDHSNDTPRPTCIIACSPQNCQGCCAGAICVTGKDSTSCGVDGNVCAQCAAGQSCANGACVAVAPCGPIECAGCCHSGVCLVGDDNTACGAGGSACEDCADAGATCVEAGCTQ
jgi:hypothetical protein